MRTALEPRLTLDNGNKISSFECPDSFLGATLLRNGAYVSVPITIFFCGSSVSFAKNTGKVVPRIVYSFLFLVWNHRFFHGRSLFRYAAVNKRRQRWIRYPRRQMWPKWVRNPFIASKTQLLKNTSAQCPRGLTGSQGVIGQGKQGAHDNYCPEGSRPRGQKTEVGNLEALAEKKENM